MTRTRPLGRRSDAVAWLIDRLSRHPLRRKCGVANLPQQDLRAAAALHLAVAAPNTLFFEVKLVPSATQHELVVDPIDQADSWISPPDAPGLGVVVDESVVATYAFDEADL